MVKEIKNDEEFALAIGDNTTGLVVLDFFAPWCGPCKQIAPKFARFADKYHDVAFYKINVDEPGTEDIATVCSITCLPTFCFFVRSQLITRMEGANEVQLEKIIIDILEQVDRANQETKDNDARNNNIIHNDKNNNDITKK